MSEERHDHDGSPKKAPTTPVVGRRGREAPSDARDDDPAGRGRPAPHNRPRPAGAGRRLIEAVAVLTITVLVAGAGIATWAATQLRPVDPGAPVRVSFEVEPGWGAAKVAEELEATGLIRNARVFSIWLQLQNLDRGIGAGLYDLSPSDSARTMADALQAGGRPRTVRLVIPEGWRATEIASRLDALGIADREAVLDLVETPGALAPAWIPNEASLEGYLFPDTYELRADGTAEDALTVALEHFEAQLDGTRIERLREAGLDVHTWVTLASMVQAEADGPDEMNVIAGVFRNRMDIGMPLQSDPTVAYGLGKALPELSALAGDLEVDHPWNTYTRGGLPRGPIGNPGLDALDAVLAPDRTRDDGAAWLYFLHGVNDDGQAVFRPNVDLASHNRDVDRYLR